MVTFSIHIEKGVIFFPVGAIETSLKIQVKIKKVNYFVVNSTCDFEVKTMD